MKRTWAQAVKEWKQLRRDKLVMALAVIMPLVLAMLFGTSISLRLENVPLVVVDEDNTPLSRTYVETYAAAAGQFVLVPKSPRMAPADVLTAGVAKAVLIVPVHFERDFRKGQKTAVQLLIDGSDANSGTVLKNVAQALNQAFLLRNSPAGSSGPPVRLATRLWYNPGLSDARFFGSGALGLVLILFPALLGALAVAREHEQETIIQVYASTLSAPQWLIGKALPYMAVGLFEFVICFVLGLAFFEYRIPSDPTPLLVASVIYVMAAVFFGMMTGNLTGSQSAAIQSVQLGAFLISMLLAGFLVPVSNIPPQLRWISALLPARHYIEIARNSMLRDEGWSTSGLSVLMLAGLAALLFGINWRRMRRMQFPG